MFEPVKVAVGEFMQGFYRELVPTTKPMIEFVDRGFDRCFAFAPSRMIDQAEDMLASWQRNDTDQATSKPAKLPVVIVAISKDYTPTARDFSTQISDPIPITITTDDKDRYFELKMIAGDVRAQIAVIASDEPTAKSIAAQFLLHLDSPSRRSFDANYSFAGINHPFPVHVESPDNPAMNIDTGNKNITILAVDLTLKCSIPLFRAPKVGEPNDGKGTPGTNDPAGYPLVSEVNNYPSEV